MRLKNDNFKLYINYVSYYKAHPGINRLDAGLTKFSLATLSYLLLYSSFPKKIDSIVSKNVGFVVLPRQHRSFTLVKGPTGHKLGKYNYGYSYRNFLLFSQWPLNYFISTNLFYSDFFSFFYFLRTLYVSFSNTLFMLKRCRFVSIVNLNFL